MVPGVQAVVLVDDRMLACRSSKPHSQWRALDAARERDNHSLAVPTIQTGPCDSVMIPRPVQSVTWGPLSRSWSAVHTHKPCKAMQKRVKTSEMSTRLFPQIRNEMPTSMYALDCGVR